MAYIIIADRDQREICRHDLTGKTIIGRAPDCDVSVHDILLSRRHCVLERIMDQWVLVDLGSKNGTFIDGTRINRHILSDNETVLIGRSRLIFKQGAFVPPPDGTPSRNNRPVDPIVAMSGTVAAFQFIDAEEMAQVANFPRPKPQPRDPRAYAAEDVSAMVADIASSSWDSIIAGASRPRPKSRPLPMPLVRRKTEMGQTHELSARPTDAHPETATAVLEAPEAPAKRKKPARWRSVDLYRALSITTIAVASTTIAYLTWMQSIG
jgi:predicted component of type VI protein secretion system